MLFLVVTVERGGQTQNIGAFGHWFQRGSSNALPA